MGPRLSIRGELSSQRFTGKVEICGGIASGKSTLARLLNRIGLRSIHEDFRKNPFYVEFYKDPPGVAFETEVTFLMQHYHQQKIAERFNSSYCSDFSFILDEAYAAVTLSSRDLRVFRVVLRRVESELKRRVLLVRLACKPEIELGRIRRRGRRAEAGLKVDYLERVEGSLDARIRALGRSAKVLTIDSGQIDFAHEASGMAQVCRMVLGACLGQ